MIKKLIELGVSYESKDIEGLSPLEMALNYASRGGYHYQIVKIIQWYKERGEKSKNSLPKRS
jgi:ankyrin repeat protein